MTDNSIQNLWDRFCDFRLPGGPLMDDELLRLYHRLDETWLFLSELGLRDYNIVVMDVIRKRESVLLVVRARNLEGQEIT